MIYERHPKGLNARILLTSVFGPYAQDDEYGSRAINPMELYHNQVTREQGPFSLRMFHRSWGLMMIQQNIGAPSKLLDFPSLDQFVQEISDNDYDIIGIGSIIPNAGKVRKMCQLIRDLQPRCTIVVGGHVANLPDASSCFDADHIVRGDGISWFRRYLGQDDKEPINHPELLSGFGSRTMGVSLSQKPEDTAAVLIPSVGCPVGCNFCCTSAMFGGKGKFINFYETGEDLFKIMCRLEEKLKVKSFFVMDENFLLHRKRALGLLDLMKKHDKAWAIDVFSSARTLQSYHIEELVGLGLSWVWMGLEGEDSTYAKLRDVDTHQLVKNLQSHGIRVLGSSIIGLENHTPENIDAVIDYAISHNTDFHQFMLYTPMPGTPLHVEHKGKGTLLPDVDHADIHGQFAFNFQHPHISREQSGEFLRRAFQRDYEVNGPSVLRIARTLLQGYSRYKNYSDERIARRFRHEGSILPLGYSSALWAAERYFRGANAPLAAKIHQLRSDVSREFGIKSRIAAPLAGPVVYQMIRREEKRLASGWTYQPPSFVETRNWEPEAQLSGAGNWEPLPQPES
jgi:radical SAM superfamily enzyme YgiQ (UPF0313 family)